MALEHGDYQLANGSYRKYSYVGCYPLVYLVRGGPSPPSELYCADCMGEVDDIVIVGVEVNWESPDLYCDNCSERIESAYAEDDREGE